MGYHVHLIVEKNIDLYNQILKNEFKEQINATFAKQNVKVDIYISDEIYSKNNLKNYHLKQSNSLDKSFVFSNL